MRGDRERRGQRIVRDREKRGARPRCGMEWVGSEGLRGKQRCGIG